MNVTHFALIIATVLTVAGGQVLFKLGALASNHAPAAASLIERHANGWLIAALILYAAATGLWVYVLKTVPLGLAYPFFGLAFVVVPVASHFFLGEPLAWQHLAGGLVIAAGIWIVQSA